MVEVADIVFRIVEQPGSDFPERLAAFWLAWSCILAMVRGSSMVIPLWRRSKRVRQQARSLRFELEFDGS